MALACLRDKRDRDTKERKNLSVSDYREPAADRIPDSGASGGSGPRRLWFYRPSIEEAAREQWGLEPIIITADTMVFLDDRRLGKPRSEADALEMLTALQGRRHTVCTGVTVSQGEKILTEAESTGVIFRPAEKRELLSYIATGEPMDKAGAYGVQGKGALLVERLEGDFFNVMGLPVLRLSRMLSEFGVWLL